jgi:hypothetical protein
VGPPQSVLSGLNSFKVGLKFERIFFEGKYVEFIFNSLLYLLVLQIIILQNFKGMSFEGTL